MTITDDKWNAIFSGCPGAWFGNRPEGKALGHITVDPALVNEAVTYLCGFVGAIRIAGTRPSPREGIQVRLRDAAYVRAQHNAARRARDEARRSLGLIRTKYGWE